jgi:hypothetical protein
MIRIVIENLLLFLLPTALYVSFSVLAREPGTPFSVVLNRAPLLTLGLLGGALVVTIMSLFGNVGPGKPGQAYEPAEFKDGKVIPGRMK